MNLHNVRWPALVISLAVTLALLFGTNYVVQMRTVDEPLKSLYQSSGFVQNVAVSRVGSGKHVSLKLNKVPDLAIAYQRLDRETQRLMGNKPYRIDLVDNRSPELEAAFNRLNLYAQEALVVGNFAEMASRVQTEAGALGITAKVGVDGERVYLQLEKGDHYLYELLERTPKAQAVKEGGA